MKKWKRTVVYGLLTVMAVGCVGAKAYPVMAQEKEGTAGRNRLVVFVNDTIHYYDTETGEPLTDEPVLTEELCLKKDQSEPETASSHSVVMTGSDEEGILYVNRGGMYLYYPGGTMEKQLFSYGYLFSLDHVFLMNTVETEKLLRAGTYFGDQRGCPGKRSGADVCGIFI